MTENEKNQIIAEVLSSLQTNGRTIMQLTPVMQLTSNDFFEISGGKRVSYLVLANLISSIFEDDLDAVLLAVQRKTLQGVSIDTTETTATLTISTVENDVTASIPIATDATSGIITAAMKRQIDNNTNSIKLFNRQIGEIDLDEIDDLNLFDNTTGRMLRVKLPPMQSTVGWLMVLNCYKGKAAQQVFTTYLHTDSHGIITSAHEDDGTIHIYRRMYNRASYDLDLAEGGKLEPGQWSRWVEVGGDTVLATLRQADETLASRISEETAARQQADETLSGRIESEEHTRLAQDMTLGERISEETAARQQAIKGLGVNILELEERMVALSEEAYNEILAEGEIEEQVYYFIYQDNEE